MGVQGGEPGSSSQIFVVLVGDMSVLSGVLLSQSEVDHVDLAGLFPVAHHKVVRLDVAVNESLVVDVLDPLHHLVAHHESGLQIELLPGEVKQILQGLAT